MSEWFEFDWFGWRSWLFGVTRFGGWIEVDFGPCVFSIRYRR